MEAKERRLALYYLIGLITGRGHILSDSKSVIIEFSHASEYAEGIAHCPLCGWLATKPKGSEGVTLKCKNPKCLHDVDKRVRNIYNQPVETIASIRSVIIPFLQTEIDAVYSITGNKSMTLLIIDLSQNLVLFSELVHQFNGDSSYDRFRIPETAYSSSREEKIEFVNGLLDTAGFASQGGWLNRDGVNGHGRMRVYFQLVRNWNLPVEIDNYLRSEFNLPTHTIDWGHPNIRDSNLEDFHNTRPSSWNREHQLKFFPEYFLDFSFRISSKQSLFRELVDHNLAVGFDKKDDWLPPGPITKGKLKPYHPGESDVRIPVQARKHFDAFWQINLAMGCKYLTKIQEAAKSPEIFALAGITEEADLRKLLAYFNELRQKRTVDIEEKYKSKKKKVQIRGERALRLNLEQRTYEPLRLFLKSYLEDKYDEPVEAFDTSAGNLNLFLKNENTELIKAFDYCDQYKIKPDVVGFLFNSSRLAFVESKVTQLDLKALGQLIGYCMVALPQEAILVSTAPTSISLMRILHDRPDLLTYAQDKKVKLAQLVGDKVEFLDI